MEVRNRLKALRRELEEIETALPDNLPCSVGAGFDGVYESLDWLIDKVSSLEIG